MGKLKILKTVTIVIIAIVIFLLGMSLLLSQMAANYAKNRMRIDLPILHLTPSDELNNVVDSNYLANLRKYNTDYIQISLPADFELSSLAKDQKSILYKRMDKELLTGYIDISLNDPNYFKDLKKTNKFMAALLITGIRNNYDFVSRILYTTKENVRSVRDLCFLMTKALIYPRLGDEKNLKIYKFTNKDKKGYIIANISGSESLFYCHVFDKNNNQFSLFTKTFNPPLKLEEICTILSTLKKIE